jgi:opacity protein-like surface antigen
MQTRKALLISTAVAALVATASAADAASTYASIFGGVNILQNPGLKGSSRTVYHTTTAGYPLDLISSSKQSVDTSWKTGFVVGGNWGVDWGNFRTEIELAYRQNTSGKSAHVQTQYKLTEVAHFPTGDVKYGPYTLGSRDDHEKADLTMRAYSLMANAWYDFHDVSLGGFTPYVGGGIGVAEVQMGGYLGHPIFEKNETVFAWQVGAGVSMPVADNLALFVDYRYFAADNAKLKLEPGFNGGNINADFDSHSVLVGLRLSL